jgi:hypothetical protein
MNAKQLGQELVQVLLEDFPLLNEYSEATINLLIDKFKSYKNYPNKIRKYVDAFDKIRDRLPKEERDIFKYSWEELESVLSDYYQPKRIKAGKINDGEPSSDANLVYNQNGLRIYAAASLELCVKYGNGYSFCISARGDQNMYQDYRYPLGTTSDDKISFVGTPYFVFDDTKSSEKNEDGSFVDPEHLLVVFYNEEIIDYDNYSDDEYDGSFEYEAPSSYSVTDADNEGEKKYDDFERVEQVYPRLKGLRDIFKYIEPPYKEKEENALLVRYLKVTSSLRNTKFNGLELRVGNPNECYKEIQKLKKIGKVYRIDYKYGEIRKFDYSHYVRDIKDTKRFINNNTFQDVKVSHIDINDDPGLVKFLKSLEYYADEYRRKIFRNKIMNESLKPKQRLTENETGTIGEFIKFAIKNLQITQPPSGLTLSYDTNQAKEKRSFGYFDPNSNKIWIYCKNRNMADVLRTLAHELVHHKQGEEGRIEYESGKTGSDIENEANAKAGILLRDFGKLYDNIYDHLIQEGLYGDFLFGDEETGVKSGWYNNEMEEDTPFEKKIFNLFKRYASSNVNVYTQTNLDPFLPTLIQLKKDYPEIMDPYSKYSRHGVQFEGDLSPDDYIYRGTGLSKKTIQNIIQKESIENIFLYKGPNNSATQGLLVPNQVYSSKRKLSSWSTDYYNAFHFAMNSTQGELIPVVMRAKAKDANLFFSKKFLEKISGYPEEEILNGKNPMSVDIIIIDTGWVDGDPSDTEMNDNDIKSIFIKNLGYE